MKKITIKIDSSGLVKIEASGFSDAGCLSALKKIQDSLGEEVERKLKPEAMVAEKREVES